MEKQNHTTSEPHLQEKQRGQGTNIITHTKKTPTQKLKTHNSNIPKKP